MKSNKFFSIFLSILILFVFIASASATDTNSTDTLSTVDNNEILSIENNMNKTIHEKDFISYDEQFNVGNDFTLNNNDLLQQKQMDDEVTILKATPIDTKIIGKDYTLNHKPMQFIVYLKDNNNNPLKDLTVEFTINGVSYSRTTTTDGSAQLNINLGVVGNYPITYAFMGNANYKSTSAKSTIKIVTNKLSPEINANDLTKYHDESSAYKVVLLDNNGNPLVNENIQIKINGVTYTRTTGNNGDATLNINLNEGKYTITTFYDGNSYYNSISNSNIITVNKKTTTLSGDSLTKYYGDNTPYTVKIQDNNKKAISGANIIFIVNGKIYTRTTDNNGIATLNINLNEGKYQINSLFNENDDYKKSTLTKTITINKKTTTLAGSDVVKFYGDDTTYTVQLLDNNKKALANTMITINVNGVDYERTTDANGKATLNIRLMEGKYTITTKYNGNNYYKASIIKNSLIIKNYTNTPVFSVDGGYYDVGNLMLNISSDNPKSTVFYSLNNASWFNQTGYVCLNLTNGNWTIQSFIKENGIDSTIISKNYIIDNTSPIIFVNKGSGIYKNSLDVKLTAVDNVDENPEIYYSLNNELVNKKYSGNIFISNSSHNSILRFYSIDKFGHKSNITQINYFFNVNIANLNNGKFYSSINNAINDKNTNNGDIIEINDFSQKNSLVINKEVTLLSSNSYIHDKIIINTENVKIINFTIFYDGFDNAIDILKSNCTLKDCNVYSTNAYSCINIKGNHVNLLSNHFKNEKGKYGFILNSTNNNVLKDNILDSINGSVLFNSNDNYLVNNTFLFRNYSSKLKIINSFNNDVYGNNLTVGIYLLNSGNNTFHSNWIYNKPKSTDMISTDYYLVDINCPNYFNSFYLNVILFDYYSDYKTHNVHTTLNSRVDLSDNWWGEQGKLSLITYEKYRDITFNSYIDLNVYADSYIVHNGIISGVKITADLNYNSKKNEMDYKGYLPDGIPIKFKNQTHEKISYLSNGHASCYFDVSADITQFEINSNYMYKSLKLNRTACAKINVESAGLDEKGSVLKFDYDLHLDDSVNWISLISHSISNFTDELDLIVDGNIVKNLTITNSFYNKYKSLYSDNVFNAIHMYNDFIYNNLSNIKAKIYVYNAITDNIHDLDSLMKINESYFFSNSLFTLICSSMNISWENTLLDLVMDYYKLTNNEKDFVKNHHTDFYDTIKVSTTYPGDYFKKYKVLNENGYYNIQFLGNTIVRSFKINYINGAYLHTDNNKANHSDGDLINMKGNDISYEQKNIEGHYVNSDYDAFLTFTFVNTKLNNKILSFYLNEKNKIDSNGNFVYNEGFMKASYGSFLNALLTFYCVDLFADMGAKLFNVTWTRNSPIAISVQDNHDHTLLSGECDFRFGMDVVGEESNVRAFNFLVSSSFSQIEHWVMNAQFPGISPYGSVTYGLGNILLNNGSLEVLLEDGFVVIKEVNSNVRTLVIDISSGRVMDLLNTSYNGAFCYSNQQTDWACDFGYALLNNTNIFETLLNYFNNVNNTFYYLQDIINGAFESIDDYLDKMDNNILGIIGSVAISVGIAALLVSNPAGWVILGGIALASLGGLLTYYADDLNKGWNHERWGWLIFDVASSIPFGIYKTGAIMGKIILKESTFKNTKVITVYSDDMVKIIYKNYEISKTTIMYEPYGTLKSIITSIYKTTNPLKISFEIFKSFIMGYSVHQVISWFIDIYEAASSK